MTLLKLAALSVVLISNASVQAKELLVKYRYGNQIYGSELQIFDDGSVAHGERTCCPPHTDNIPETNLSTTKVIELKDWIQGAALGNIVSTSGHQTAEGSESGRLTAGQNGVEILVHVIERGTGADPKDQVRMNQSTEAGLIETLVNSYVKNPMYQMHQ